jgi:hypothetical protein
MKKNVDVLGGGVGGVLLCRAFGFFCWEVT